MEDRKMEYGEGGLTKSKLFFSLLIRLFLKIPNHCLGIKSKDFLLYFSKQYYTLYFEFTSVLASLVLTRGILWKEDLS